MGELSKFRLPAPAKLNLMLRVVGRRDDGYHLLQTVFQLIDCCDWITLSRREDGEIRLKTPLPGVPPENDLTVRAARALKDAAGSERGVDIEIEKNLPMGGGLGGGSSDAATTLLGLNRLWQTDLSLADLSALGVGLGADVPVFLQGHSAWGEGVGELLTPLDLPERWYVVVVPQCQVSTGQIFSAPNLTRNSPPIKIADFLGGWQGNDCLTVVTERYPEVRAAVDDLNRFGNAMLTGTGACVFAPFDSEGEARRVAEDLGSRWRVLVARGVNRSPILDVFGSL